jgi:hypothetical protein
MHGLRAAAIAAGALMAATVASTATLDSLKVEKHEDIYSLYAETMLDASPQAIHEVLTDYERFNRISSVYKEHGYLEPLPDGTQVIYTTMRGCLLGYCKSLTRVERVEVSTPGHIRTVTIPERSDFKHAVSEWLIEEQGSRSRVIYTLEMEPDFWMPPVIGSYLFKHKLRNGGRDALDRIEQLAQEVDLEEAEQEAAVLGAIAQRGR